MILKIIFYFEMLIFSIQIATVILSPVMELHTLQALEEIL